MMRHTIVLSSLVAFSLLSACDRHPAEQADATVAATDAATPAATPAPAPESTVPAVVAWGPRKTLQGQAVNAQKTGESGIWMKVEGIRVSKDASITFDGKKVEKVHVRPSGDLVTMGIPLDYLTTPGKKAIVLKTSVDGPELSVGEFEVLAQ